jgi:hypothetical protein
MLPTSSNQGSGPPKHHNRFRAKLEAAGFGQRSLQDVARPVHYAWSTLALTYPVECALFRAAEIAGVSIEAIREEIRLGEKTIAEVTVRRAVKFAEDLFIVLLQFYIEADEVKPGTAARIFGCYQELAPDSEGFEPLHRKLLQAALHARECCAGAISEVVHRTMQNYPACSALASLFPGLADVLTAAAEFLEARQICMCAILIAHSKDLDKEWKELLEVIQPGAPPDSYRNSAQERAQWLIRRARREEVQLTLLALMARSELYWPDLCKALFPALVGIAMEDRVGYCYLRMIGLR